MQQIIFIADFCNKYHLLHLVGILFPHDIPHLYWRMSEREVMTLDKYNFKFYVKRLFALYRYVRQLILSTVCTILLLKLRSHWFDTLNGIVYSHFLYQ